MPHKRNPILSERIAGLARLLRGYAHTALEDQPLWHERDISHSSAERVILPDATILLDYMLVRMTGLVDGLLVRSERMRENIARGLGLHASSRVLARPGRRGRAVARGRLRHRPARVAPGGRRARGPARPPGGGSGGRPAPVARPARRMLRRRRLPAARAGGHRAARRALGATRRTDGHARRRRPMLAESYLRSGKVRDLYMLNDGRLLLVASDRISRLRRRAAVDDPRQGPRPDRPVPGSGSPRRPGSCPNHLLDTDVAVLEDYRARTRAGSRRPARDSAARRTAAAG